MKLQRFFGGMLLYLGIVVLLIALIATVLPMIPNDQIRLILDSLQTRSRSVVANTLNEAMLFILRHHFPLLGAGAGLILVGAFLRRSARGSQSQADSERPLAMERGPYTVLADKKPNDLQRAIPDCEFDHEIIFSPKPSVPSPLELIPPPTAPAFKKWVPPPSAPPPSPLPPAPVPPAGSPSRGGQSINPYHAYGQRPNPGPAPQTPFSRPQGAPPFVPPVAHFIRPTSPPLGAAAGVAAPGRSSGAPAQPYQRFQPPPKLKAAADLPTVPPEKPAATGLKPSPATTGPKAAPATTGLKPPPATTGLKPPPASMGPLPQDPPAPEKDNPDLQYISQRIRSTMKRKSS